MRSTCFLAIFSLFEGKKIFTRQGVGIYTLRNQKNQKYDARWIIGYLLLNLWGHTNQNTESVAYSFRVNVGNSLIEGIANISRVIPIWVMAWAFAYFIYHGNPTTDSNEIRHQHHAFLFINYLSRCG